MKRAFLLCIVSAITLATSIAADAAYTDPTPVETAKVKEYEAGMAAVKRKDWSAAARHFEAAVAAAPNNADAHNMLGYSYRWLGKYKEAFASYERAFAIDPDHRGAHEYVGVAYLKQKNPDKAKWHLTQLERICGKQCEEYKDLAKAIEDFAKSKG